MRIPITMCHGIVYWKREIPLDAGRLETYFKIAADMGFESISYNDLENWMKNDGQLPKRPIMFDFDHPEYSIYRKIFPIMERYGFKGNLFVYTRPLEKLYASGDAYSTPRKSMNWDEIGELLSNGWNIGSHMHVHYNMFYLATKDPTGALIREQFEICDEYLAKNLGIVSRDFAFTSTTWSEIAEREVKKRYRFGRLWIIGSHYQTDKGDVRFADLVGVPGEDEVDGGPPNDARYITENSNPYRLPSMELEYLIFEYDAFRKYLEGALAERK